MPLPKTSKMSWLTGIAWLFFLFLLHPTQLYIIPYAGLDNSWNIAINWAVNDGWVFGKDFVFTYGPLGYLGGTYLTLGVSKWVYFSYNLWLWALMGFALYKVLEEMPSIYTLVYIFISILLLQLFIDRFFICLYLQIFLSSLFIQEKLKGLPWLLLLSFLAVYLFFSKLNIGFIALAFHLVFIIYLTLRKKIQLRTLCLIILVTAFTLGTLVYILKVDLMGYIVGSIHIISAYNDAMYLPFKRNKLLDIIIAYGLFFSFGFLWIRQGLGLLRKKGQAKDLDALFIQLCLAGFFYILIKQGFTRADDPHEYIFFAFLSWLGGGLYFFTKDTALQKSARVYATLAIVSASSFYVINNFQTFVQNTIQLDFLLGHTQSVIRYWGQVASPVEGPSFHLWPPETELPKSMVEKIGQETIDIVPYELSIAYRYGLNFSPRPVVQSYSAYDAYLDRINAQRYASDLGPQFILFRVETIDDRYPFYDESQTKLAMLRHYQIDTVSQRYLLFSRREKPRDYITLRQDTIQIKMGDTLSLEPTEALQWAQVQTHYNLWGTLLRFFLQPPDLQVEVTYQDGSSQVFRACKTILEAGVILNKHIPGDNFKQKEADVNQSQAFFGSFGKDAKSIRKVRFFSNKAYGFNPTISVQSSYYTTE